MTSCTRQKKKKEICKSITAEGENNATLYSSYVILQMRLALISTLCPLCMPSVILLKANSIFVTFPSFYWAIYQEYKVTQSVLFTVQTLILIFIFKKFIVLSNQIVSSFYSKVSLYIGGSRKELCGGQTSQTISFYLLLRGATTAERLDARPSKL